MQTIGARRAAHEFAVPLRAASITRSNRNREPLLTWTQRVSWRSLVSYRWPFPLSSEHPNATCVSTYMHSNSSNKLPQQTVTDITPALSYQFTRSETSCESSFDDPRTFTCKSGCKPEGSCPVIASAIPTSPSPVSRRDCRAEYVFRTSLSSKLP